MSGPSDKAAELGKTQSQKIGDIQAELLLLLNQKMTEVRKMKKAFLARKQEDKSIAEMIIPPEFVEQADKDKKRKRTTAKLIGLTYFSFELQNYVLSDIENLLSQRVKVIGEKHSSRKFSFAERLEGWRIERTMRITGNCDMCYYHLQSQKYFRTVSDVIDFLLYEKYSKTGNKRKDKEIAEEKSDVENLLNVSSQITEDSYNEILQEEDLYAIYLSFVHSGSKNIFCQPVGQTGDSLQNDEYQETHIREKEMGNKEKMNSHLFGLENMFSQPTDKVGDFLLYDQYPDNPNRDKNKGNDEKMNFDHFGLENICLQQMNRACDFLLNDEYQETHNIEKNMGNKEIMNFHFLGSENICCQPTNKVGDFPLYDQYSNNHNREINKGNGDKKEVIDLLSEVNNEKEDNVRKRSKTIDFKDALNDEKFWVEMSSIMLEDYPMEKQDLMKTNSLFNMGEQSGQGFIEQDRGDV